MNHTSDSAPTPVQQLQAILIRRQEVERLTALSRSRIYALMELGEFPKPVRLGSMSVAWNREEVLFWISERMAERDVETA